MNIKQRNCYRARVNYQRTDNLKQEAPANGSELIFEAVFIINKDEECGGPEEYHGQWAFMPVNHKSGWLPECDLILLEDLKKHKYEFKGEPNYV